MKTTCKKCGHSYDIGIPTVLQWIYKSEKLKIAASSVIGKINAQKRKAGPNPNMIRGDSAHYKMVRSKRKPKTGEK